MILKKLNDNQRKAVEYCDGPSLIIAGAGSGKTRVLTHKIAYLLEQDYKPYQLLALTFTNKAAREMRSRIGEIVGESKARQLWMGTFHSVFSRILRSEADKLGFDSNYTIFDTADSRNLIRLIIKELKLDEKIYKANGVHSHISRAKNGLLTPRLYAQNKEILEYDRISNRPLIYEIYNEYQKRLKLANSMDFDDLLMYTNILFRDHKEVLRKYQDMFSYVLVDEYQDTNYAQHLIVKQLSETHNKVFVVGDDAQSIYSFRGANIDNILKFKTSFPGTKIFKLEQNYRSTQNIVNTANSLIKKNEGQIYKDVFSENEPGDKVRIVSAFSDYEEGAIVVKDILAKSRQENNSYADFAILYRTNAQSRIFEESLRKESIPYVIYGGHSFFQRKEIKDVIGYFRLIVNPSDEEAFRRIINFPARKLGAVTLNKISEASRLHGVSMWDVVASPLTYNLQIHSGTANQLKKFHELLTGFIIANETSDAAEMAEMILQDTRILQQAYEDLTPEGMSRAQNIQELLNAVEEFVSMRREEGDEEIKLVDYLSYTSLLTDQDESEDEDNKATLMTVHSAKGLEFDHVYVVGLEEELFPSSMAANEISGLEEERRLLYVAITRAKVSCTITYAKSRLRHGSVNTSRPSRFINDLATEYIDYPKSWEQTDRVGRIPFGQSTRSTVRSSSAYEAFKRSSRSVPVSSVGSASESNLSAEAQSLRVGNIIEHNRFGVGEVMSIEDDGNNKRAFVTFESAGSKQLLLKYAKFKIVK